MNSYTSYEVGPKRINTSRDPDGRAQRAQRFRTTYASLGLTRLDVAKLLHVTPRTLHNWVSGRCDIPYAAFKLLRVLLRYELPGDDWQGWHFTSGKLFTPEGRFIEPWDSDWWSLLVRKAQSFSALYARCSELEQAARHRAASGSAAAPEAVPLARRNGVVLGSAHVGKKVPWPAAPVRNLPHGNHGDNRRRSASWNEVAP